MATDELSKVFSALADPTRRAILLRLGEGQATVTELAQPFPISLPAVSRHLKVLAEAGLISRDRRAQWRTSTLRPEPLREATTWMDHLSTLWDQRFDRLDAHLATLQAQLRNAAGDGPDLASGAAGSEQHPQQHTDQHDPDDPNGKDDR